MIPGQIPGFVGSPCYELAVITEKWSPLCVVGNISPHCMADYFQGLNKDMLIMEERQLASKVAWLLLNALNHAEMRNNTLENENQLLKDCIEKLEQELGILTGKKPILHLPIGQVRNISINNDQAPESTDCVDQENKQSKSDLESPVLMDALESVLL